MNRTRISLTLCALLMLLVALAFVVSRKKDPPEPKASRDDTTSLPAVAPVAIAQHDGQAEDLVTESIPIEASPGIIRGRLYREDGSAGTEIEIFARCVSGELAGPADATGSTALSVLPDDEGTFSFDNLPFGRFVVYAEADDAVAKATCHLSIEEPVADTLLVLRKSNGIAGMVLDGNGAGIAGAIVYPLLRDGIPLRHAEVLEDSSPSDEQGNFALPHLAAGDWVLQAAAKGFASATSAPLASGTQDAVIRLEPGVPVCGRVLSGTLPAADVKLTMAAAVGNAPPLSVLSDGQGEFCFDAVGPGRYEIRGERDGAIIKDSPHRIAVTDTTPGEIALELIEGGNLRGRVIDQDSGDGVQGVTVNALLEGGTLFQRTSEASDELGQFEINGLDPGPYQVFPRDAPGYSRFGRAVNPLKITVLPGRTSEGLVISLGRGIVVSGHVLDTEGLPVAGASVSGRKKGWQDQQRSGSDGAFSLTRLTVGEPIVVQATTTGARSPVYTLEIPEAGLSGVELILESVRDGLIAGVVVDLKGRPFPGQVSLAPAEGEIPQPPQRTETDADGRFLFPNVAPGAYRIGGSTGDGMGQLLHELHIKSGQKIRNLRLIYQQEDFLEISGRVLDETGAPVVANLRLERQEEETRFVQAHGQTSVDATFRFQGLEEGTYIIGASSPGYVDASVGDVAAGASDVMIVMTPKSAIRGFVVSGENIPITSFEVLAHRAGTNLNSLDLYLTPFKYFSNSEGAFVLEVDEGPYDVIARAPGYAMGRAHVGFVGPDALPEEIVVRLEKREALQGMVVDAEGNAVVGAAIFLGPLPAGAERLTRFAATYSDANGEFGIDAPEADRGLHLSAFHRIAGGGDVFGESDAAEPIIIQLAPLEPAEIADGESN